MEESKIKEAYQHMQEGLPDYDLINAEFEIEKLEKSNFLLRSIRRTIMDHIDNMLKVVEDCLHPEGRLTLMLEANAIEDQDREVLQNLLKQLAQLYRQAQVAALTREQEKEFILKTTLAWPQVRSDLAPIVQKIQVYWDSNEKITSDNGYFG